jgi:hypothetical protein
MRFAARCQKAGEIIEYHPPKLATVANLPAEKHIDRRDFAVQDRIIEFQLFAHSNTDILEVLHLVAVAGYEPTAARNPSCFSS